MIGSTYPPMLQPGEPTQKVYHFRVRLPTRGGQSHIHAEASAFGATADAAAQEIIRRYPDCDQVTPDDFKGEVPTILREVLCEAPPESDVSHWCRVCGQASDAHPILSGSAVGEAARRWIDLNRSDMGGGNFWD